MENPEINPEDFAATYSPEDNKLRITAAYRLPEDLYKEFKETGFRWAPKQEIFIAPMWTPAREDFCLKVAGSIEAEQSTMVERAEAKVERLENLAEKRGRESNHFATVADRIAERFYGGQPILVGHHSERKARKDQEKIHSNMRKSIQCREAVNYWNYKAEGVERHANRKADPRVRARRIKGLLADLRDRQRVLNHANICFKLWTKIHNETDPQKFENLTRKFIGAQLSTGGAAPWGLWSDLDRGKVTGKEAADKALKNAENILNNPYYHRWIAHILNRLGYERSEMGAVQRFEGELTPVILQVFTREQGAHKPAAKKTGSGFIVESAVALPAHLSEHPTLELNAQDWIGLIQVVGYTIPAPKDKKPPILNFEAQTLTKAKGQWGWDKAEIYQQVKMTKAQYKEINGWIFLSSCGQFRFRGGYTGSGISANRVAVFLTDSKVHPAPESGAINHVIQEA